MQPSRILVSACLLGEPVRYDGRCKELEYPQLDELLKQDRVIGFCPEVAGGLPVPRDAAEIQTGDGYADPVPAPNRRVQDAHIP